MIVIKLCNHFLHPFRLFFLNQVMIRLLIIFFLFLCRLWRCSLPYRLTPLCEFGSLRLLLSVVDSFHVLQSAVACDPEVASLVFEKFEVLMGTSPGSGTDRDCGKDCTLVIFHCSGPVSVPISVGKEPGIFRSFSREIFPSDCLNSHSSDLFII